MSNPEKVLKQSADEWLKIAVKEIRTRIKKLRVHESGELYRTLHGSIHEISKGDRYRAALLYNYYGIFPDIGVGKGVPKDEVRLQKLLQGGRRAKPWTRAVAHQSHRFGDIMRDAYGRFASEAIAGSLQRKVVIDL